MEYIKIRKFQFIIDGFVKTLLMQCVAIPAKAETYRHNAGCSAGDLHRDPFTIPS
jgi:hypothetical protein